MISWSFLLYKSTLLLYKSTAGKIFKLFATIINRFRMERVISLPIFKICVISVVKKYFFLRGLSKRRNIEIGDIFTIFLILIVVIPALELRWCQMISNCFASAFLLCENGTLIRFLHRLNTLQFQLNWL